jgi:hypothetical protein
VPQPLRHRVPPLDKAVYVNSVRSKAYVYGDLPAETAGSNPPAAMDVCRYCFVLSGRSLRDELFTRSEVLPTVCVCVCVCDLQTSRQRRPWPALGRRAKGKKKIQFVPKVNTDMCHRNSVGFFVPRCLKRNVFVVILVVRLKCI